MDEQERVEYSFTGDVTSLRKATEEAIALLDKYSKSFRTTASAGNFGASERSAKSLKSTLNGLSKRFETIQKQMKGLSDSILVSDNSAFSGIKDLVRGLEDQYKQYQDSLAASLKSTGDPKVAPEKLFSTKEINSFVSQAKESRKSLDSIAAGIDSVIPKERDFQNALDSTTSKISDFRSSAQAFNDVSNATKEVSSSSVDNFTSLRRVLEDSIALLDKYDVQVKRLSALDVFGKNKNAAKSFQRSFSEVQKTVEGLKNMMEGLSDVKIDSDSTEARSLAEALSNLNSIYKTLETSTRLTTAEVRKLDEAQRTARKSFEESSPGIAKHIEEQSRLQDTLNDTSRVSQSTSETLNNMGSRTFSSLDPLIQKIKSLGASFISSSSAVQSMKDKAERAFGRLSTFLDSVTAAFRRFQQTEDSTGESHDRLSDTLERIRNAFRKETEAVEDEEKKLKDKNKTLKDSGSRHSSLIQILTSLGRLFSRESTNIRNYTNNLNLMSKASGVAKKALAGLTGIKIGEWLSQAVNKSIEYVENLNLFTVAMGKSVDEGKKFVDKMSEIYGMDPSNLYRYTGYFYQLTDAIGMADDASAALSLSMTKAANDIASLFNARIENVVENLASGMQGISRSVRKYGMDIRTTTLQQTAYNYGITEEVKNMSEADRMALRYLTMMEQVKNATHQLSDETGNVNGVMGDFARNIETPANQLRIFKEQISQLGRAIGNFFIPMLKAVLPVLNGIIMALRTILVFIATLTGIDFDFGGSFSGAAESIGATGQAIADAGDEATETGKKIKKLQNTVLGFDELNLLQAPPEDTSDSSSKKGDADQFDNGLLNPILADAIKNMKLDLEDIKMKANKVRDAILEFLGFKYDENGNLKWFADQFEQNLINKFPQWEKTIKALFDNWTAIIEGFKKVFKSIGKVIDSVKKKMKDWIDSLKLDDKFSAAIEALPDSLNRLADWIDQHADKIASFVILLGQLYLAFRVLSSVYAFLKPLIALGAQIAPVVAQISSFLAPILAVAATIALLYTNSEAFATSFKNLFQTIVDSLTPIVESVETLVQRIWASLQSLWEEHLQPMVQSIGDMLAPILDTLSVFWQALSEIFQNVMGMLGNIWENTIHPIIAAVADAITNLANIIRDLWEVYIGPVINNILQSLPSLWESIRPVVESIIAIIGDLIELVLALWNNILAPALDWWIKTFGPEAAEVFNMLWDIFKQTFTDMMDIVDALLGVLHGLIEFIVGVFTKDWDRAIRGLKKVFVSIINGMISAVESTVNAIISVINALINRVYSAIQNFVNGLLNKISKVASLAGYNISITWDSAPPSINYLSIPRVAYANGGFPEDGFFFANHNELVGEFANGKTAVANNEQITAGIENAVYRAFTRAFSESGENSKNGAHVAIFEINGREFCRAIYDDQQAIANERGISLISSHT